MIDDTPSVHFNFEDTAQRTPWLNLSKEPLSFKLSATSRHQPSNRKQVISTIQHETIRQGRSLARSILNEIQNAQSPVHQRIHHIKTDEFFEQFDQVFEVKFESPVKEQALLEGEDKKMQQQVSPLQIILQKDFFDKREPAIKRPLIIDRKSGSCKLGQFEQPEILQLAKSSHKILLNGKHQHTRQESKIVSNSHTFRPKDITNHNKSVHQLSVISVEAKEKLDFLQRCHHIPTIKRGRGNQNCLHGGNLDELNTVVGRVHIMKDHFVRSGTLQNWKRKFNEKRLRSRESDIAKTVKTRSSKHRYANNQSKARQQPTKIGDFCILRRNR